MDVSLVNPLQIFNKIRDKTNEGAAKETKDITYVGYLFETHYRLATGCPISYNRYFKAASGSVGGQG